MVLSETEAERRLDMLRRQREAIDRAITDLALYLELGRRLSEPSVPAAVAAQDAAQAATPGPEGPRPADRDGSRDRPAPSGPLAGAGHPSEAGPAHALADDPADGAAARRYGRTLIHAAVTVLEEAGRPLHVGEILAGLTERGFAIPGQQDPVAALNTRLWKRSGPGGPVRRLGDAIYALPGTDESTA